MSATIHQLRFTHAELKALGEPERKLFIAAAHAANEITVLQKALVRSMGFPANQDEAKKATSTQNLVLAKLLAGKLNEAWQMLRTCYFSGISRELNPLHPDEPKAAERALNRYFGRRNAINEVRTNFASHYSPDGIIEALDQLSDEFEFEGYIGEEVGNSLFYFAEEPVFRQLTDSIPHDEKEQPFDRFISDVSVVARDVLTLLGSIIIVLMSKFCPGRALTNIEVEDADAPAISVSRLPYFFTREE